MDVRRHVIASTVISALMLIALKRVQVSVACLLTGILIDLDHIFDHYVNSEKVGFFHYLRRLHKLLWRFHEDNRPFRKIYKLLHSVELLIPASALYIIGVWSDIATGMLVGFVVHLMMDFLTLGHVGAISLVYKIYHDFPNGSDIMKHRLSRRGRDPDKCEHCGMYGETVLCSQNPFYIGSKWRNLNRITILCPACHDLMHRKDYL